MKRYRPLLIEVKDNPIMFVGIAVGRKRKSCTDDFAWYGSRSADLLHQAIVGKTNIIMTNILDYYVSSSTYIPVNDISKGLKRLIGEIDKYKPRKIIALGKLSFDALMMVKIDIPIIPMYHPSYILRFNVSKKDFIRRIHEAML